MSSQAEVVLIPNLLGDGASLKSLSTSIKEEIQKIKYFVVENEKSARRFIKKLCPEIPQASLDIKVFNKHKETEDYSYFLKPALEHLPIGIISEAGCPAIADPGSELVNHAHKLGIRVRPLVGPSSILLGLMASGMNGQSFTFHGYLPIENPSKSNFIKKIERLALQDNQTQIFIETPYRNRAMLSDLLNNLKKETRLCVCIDLTLPSEKVISKPVKLWNKIGFNKKPAIFLIGR